MPLPPALAAKLAKRGILNDHGHQGNKETGCPNRSNPYHQCSAYCVERWGKAPPSAPLSLPEPWKVVIDKKSGDTYFWNPTTQEVTWDRPLPSDDTNSQPDFDSQSGEENNITSNKRSHESRDEDDDENEELAPNDPFSQRLAQLKKRAIEDTETKFSQGAVIDDPAAANMLPNSGIIRHEICWKCGKKNPLPEGICIKCASHAGQKQNGQAKVSSQRPTITAPNTVPHYQQRRQNAPRIPPPRPPHLLPPPVHPSHERGTPLPYGSDANRSAHSFPPNHYANRYPPGPIPYSRGAWRNPSFQPRPPPYRPPQAGSTMPPPAMPPPSMPPPSRPPSRPPPKQMQKAKKLLNNQSEEEDPMDPSSYSDVERGGWGAGLSKQV